MRKKGLYTFAEKHPEDSKLCKDKNIINEVAEFSNKKAIFICSKCGREKEYKFSTIAKKGFHYDICDRTPKKLTKERYAEQIKQAGGNFEILEEIESASKPVKIKCLDCRKEWAVAPSSFVNRGCKCKFCAPRLFPRTYDGINITNSERVKYFKNKEDAKNYSYGSNKIVEFICPDCGAKFKKKIKDFMDSRFPCQFCADGVSFPNKILRQIILKFQNKLDEYDFEYRIEKESGKRYDGYFKYKGQKYLVEMNGEQHYKDAWTSYKTQKENDIFKKELAQKLNYNLITIDCSSGDFENIKQQIRNSKLQYIFKITEEEYLEIGKKAERTLIKQSWDMYLQGEKYKEIADKLGVNRITVGNYIIRGEDLGVIPKLITASGHRTGGNLNRRVRVNMYDSKKNFVCTFDKIIEIEKWFKEEMGLITKNVYISNHCKNGLPYHGYYFYFADSDPNIQKGT